MSDKVKDWIWGFVIALALFILWKACDYAVMDEEPAVEADSLDVSSDEYYEDSTYIVDEADSTAEEAQ